MTEYGPPCNREHGPNPYPPNTVFGAQWEFLRACRDLQRVTLRIAGETLRRIQGHSSR